jgi:anti-sigma-K factor RskA
MTDQAPEHTIFDELAAGYVLYALEPADEQRFLRHAEQCSRCHQTLTEFQKVAAALADTAPPAEASARLGERIMAVARADLAEQGHPPAPPADSGGRDAGTALDDGTALPGGTASDHDAASDHGTALDEGATTRGEDAPPDDAGAARRPGTPSGAGTAPGDQSAPGDRTASGDQTASGDRTGPDDAIAADQGSAAPAGPAPGRVVPLRRRAGRGTSGRRWQKPAVAAAAAVLIAVGGVWAGLAATSGGRPQPLAACSHPHACQQVTLTSATTDHTAAKVVIDDGVAWMEPSAMRANSADEIYVLWQVTGAPVPLAVGSFDVKAGTTSAIKVGALPAPYHGTHAFAVSLEHGRTIPPRPSTPVAAGKVS